MTQRIIISIFFLAALIVRSGSVSARDQREIAVKNITSSETHTAMKRDPAQPVKGSPMIPVPKPEPSHGKSAHVPHMEELPHVHRYHKERVKKAKRHTGKLWFLGQLLVVLCNLALLFIAYQHVTH